MVDDESWADTVRIFDASCVPPRRDGMTGPRPAHRVPVNSPEPVKLENESFVGSVLCLARPRHSIDAEQATYPYKWHFGSKSRSWELRFQGRFKQPPRGERWGGLEIYDFDYSVQPNMAARMLSKIALPLLGRAVGQDVYFSWGDRGDVADPESLCIVGGWAGWDQVIATAPDEAPPHLASDLTTYGLRRNSMPAAQYKQQVGAICAALDSSKTYTFCFWGPSRFADLISWTLRGLLPRSIPLAACLGNWPAHFVLYELDSGCSSGSNNSHGSIGLSAKHVESRKKYLLDLLIWSSGSGNAAVLEANIQPRYDFTDISLLNVPEPASG